MVCCRVSRSVAVCCSVLQCVVVRLDLGVDADGSTDRSEVCGVDLCSVLRCVSVCCRALRCVTVCCSVLQCVNLGVDADGSADRSEV